jgi:hypothetical protein
VIAGDQNSDPLDGDTIPGSIQQLIEHPLVNVSKTPASAGAVEAAALQGGANASHRSDPRFDTADFADTAPGNLHADYVLPSKNMKILDSAVFWPVQSDPLFRLTGVFNFAEWGPVGGFPTSRSPARLGRRQVQREARPGRLTPARGRERPEPAAPALGR